MITYQQAISMLKGVVCPRCLRPQLVARFRLADRFDCLCTAHCEHCGQDLVVQFTKFRSLNVRAQRTLT